MYKGITLRAWSGSDNSGGTPTLPAQEPEKQQQVLF